MLLQSGEGFVEAARLLSSALLIKSSCHMQLCFSYLWTRSIHLACDKQEGIGLYTFSGFNVSDMVVYHLILFVHKAFSALDFYLTAELFSAVYTVARRCFVRVLSLGNIDINCFQCEKAPHEQEPEFQFLDTSPSDSDQQQCYGAMVLTSGSPFGLFPSDAAGSRQERHSASLLGVKSTNTEWANVVRLSAGIRGSNRAASMSV